MASRPARFALSAGLAVAISVVATIAVGLTWTAIGGGAMSVHGWIALGIGIFGTAAMAWGLMALAFRSDREGWDDCVDKSPDASRNADEP